jgi:hypothetical protein
MYFKSIKLEKEGYLKLTDVAKDLNNVNLQDAASKLSQSNSIKFGMFLICIFCFFISILAMFN